VRICDYAAELVAEKRSRPGDDLTSALIASAELTDDEVVAMAAAIILGGSDTIRAFIGNAVLALLDHPDQRDLLLAQPELSSDAVEEFVRYDGPFTTVLFRLATEDVEYAGTTIPAGSPVVSCQSAANRDPRQFSHPDRLDIARTDNRHLGWGTASTTAWVRRWRGWRARSRCPSCSGVSRSSGWRSPARTSATSKACRCAGSSVCPWS
jgi:cytochrome P450